MKLGLGHFASPPKESIKHQRIGVKWMIPRAMRSTRLVEMKVIITLGWIMALFIRSFHSRNHQDRFLANAPQQPAQQHSFVDNNISTTQQEQPPKIAIYMTSHLSFQHRKFLRHCWNALSRDFIERFPAMELVLYVSNDPPTEVLSQWAFVNIQIHRYNDTNSTNSVSQIKQQGAMQAITDALEHHWWDSYDWIIRLNPDVLVRNMTWLQTVLRDDSIDGVFHDCFQGIAEQEGRVKLHTDFFAVRPKALDPNLFVSNHTNAEEHLTSGVANLLNANRVAWIPGAESPYPACRIQGEHSPVIHHHQMWKQCSAG